MSFLLVNNPFLDMSAQENDTPPLSFQKSVISANLNSTLLYVFFSGTSRWIVVSS